MNLLFLKSFVSIEKTQEQPSISGGRVENEPILIVFPDESVTLHSLTLLESLVE
ncbi:hypothetical protein D3C87_1890430 [compost metagenome]